MSKFTKLVNNPKQFFWDVRPIRHIREALPFEIVMTENKAPNISAKNGSSPKVNNKTTSLSNSKVVTSPKKKKQPVKELVADNIVQIKNSLKSVVNDIHVSNVNLKHHEVALYFSGGMGNIYQIEQWLGPLECLDKETPVVIVTRVKQVYEWLTLNTNFVVVYCHTIQDLTTLYEESDFKCILYVNHGYKNFQSLINHRALHIHISHGESDKTSTITNQAKSYDYVYIVAKAGYDKYNNNLINKNMQNFIEIGRPQLEHIPERESFKTDKTTVLYAPTWEGTHESMNFSSLQEFGLSIIQQLMSHPDYFIVYKPHPNTGSRNTNIKNINEAIINMLNEHEAAEVILSGDINSLYPYVDICVFDNSAVAIDYLIVDKPMLMTDMFHRIKGRSDKPIITEAARMIKPLEALNIVNIIKEELEVDTKKAERQHIKQYFLGDIDYDNGESTATFVTKVLEACQERDSLIENMPTI